MPKLCCICEKPANEKNIMSGLISDGKGGKIKMVAYLCDEDRAQADTDLRANFGQQPDFVVKWKQLEAYDMKGKLMDMVALREDKLKEQEKP